MCVLCPFLQKRKGGLSDDEDEEQENDDKGEDEDDGVGFEGSSEEDDIDDELEKEVCHCPTTTLHHPYCTLDEAPCVQIIQV